MASAVRPVDQNCAAMVKGGAISLFSGAGGLDLGIEAAGFQTLAAVEWDEDAADTMEKNAPAFFPALKEVLRADLYPLATGDGVGMTTRDLLRAGGLGPREKPDLLVGGPPCVAFSKSGFWLDWKRDAVDPAASLLQAYTKVLAEARPRFFILENVYALTFDNKASRPAFTRLLAEIEAAGYKFNWQVLNAGDYGVPQLRPRLFIVGARKGDAVPDLPEPTHFGDWERRTNQGTGPLPHVTTGQALAGLVTTPEPEEVGPRSMGPPPAWNPAGRQLPLLHREAWTPRSAVRVALAILVVPAEARPKPGCTHHPGSARTQCRSVPLGQPAATGARAPPALHLPR